MPLDLSNSGTVAGRRWDPEAVLKLSLDGRCVGWAPSRGRKCRMPIRQDNTHRVEILVADLANQSPNPERLRSKLQCLAEHGLCVRFHQHQVDEMLDRWIKRMWEAFPGHDRVSERVDATSERVRQQPGSANVVAPSESELAARAEAQQAIDVLQQSLRDANRRLEELTARQAAHQSMAQLETRLSRITTSSDPPLSSSQPPNVLSNLRFRRSFAPIRPVFTVTPGRRFVQRFVERGIEPDGAAPAPFGAKASTKRAKTNGDRQRTFVQHIVQHIVQQHIQRSLERGIEPDCTRGIPLRALNSNTPVYAPACPPPAFR